MHTQPRDELLCLKEVCAFFGGLDPSTIYRNVRRGVIPAPIRVTANTSRWLRSECEAALARVMEGRRERPNFGSIEYAALARGRSAQ
jgi:predicted DNA-binding transcriptional regulator AlpA